MTLNVRVLDKRKEVDECFMQSEKQHPESKANNLKSMCISFGCEDSSVSTTAGTEGPKVHQPSTASQLEHFPLVGDLRVLAGYIYLEISKAVGVVASEFGVVRSDVVVRVEWSTKIVVSKAVTRREVSKAVSHSEKDFMLSLKS
ncbi:unnamed protein product [Dovyalis caffra]|uniref:Uncharacterized protein n=1 Tax=Dovyalis caffra TaxID=77055 RepID=A0AAV1SNX1_9ROSI|nr:unnamed protein product [Dovyalis caffra]